MKTLSTLILGFGVLVGAASAQTITGKVINNSGQPQNNKLVEAHLTIDGIYAKGNDLTNMLGDFTINNVTDVEETETQTNQILYYANNIELPKDAKIVIYNILGQKINTIKGLTGVNKLPTQNLADGTYFTQIQTEKEKIINKFITRNGKIQGVGTTTKEWKEVIKNPTMPKILEGTTLDSITVSGQGIQTKTFHYGITIENNHDVGDLIVEPKFVTINGQVIRLHRYNQPNNEVSNALVKIGDDSTFTDGLGNFSLIAPSGENSLIITHPEYYTRETLIKALSDTTIAEHITKHEDMPANVYEFYNLVTGRAISDPEFAGTRRWKQPPIFYINVDTTTQDGLEKYLQQKAKIDTVLKPLYETPDYPEGFLKDAVIETGLNPPADGTPGYYIIRWEPNIGPKGITGPYTDYTIGEIYSAFTIYNTTNNFQTMDRITIKELSTGISGMGRYDNIPSLWNVSVQWENRNGGPNDFQIIDWQYSRPGKNLIEDKDNGWYNWWEE